MIKELNETKLFYRTGKTKHMHSHYLDGMLERLVRMLLKSCYINIFLVPKLYALKGYKVFTKLI